MRHSPIKILLALVVLGAAGLGCHAGRNVGEACADTPDCRTDLLCFDGECTPPGQCPTHAPAACGDGTCCPQAFNVCCGDGNCYGSAAECRAATCADAGGTCRGSGDCCAGLTCQAGTCRTATPICAGRPCVNSTSCCTDYACSRFGKTCRSAKSLAIGEPCTSNLQCTSGLCIEFCTKACSKTADCGGVNNCLETTSGFLCIPFCSTSSDCAVFGTGLSCQKGTDPGGLSLNGCFAR